MNDCAITPWSRSISWCSFMYFCMIGELPNVFSSMFLFLWKVFPIVKYCKWYFCNVCEVICVKCRNSRRLNDRLMHRRESTWLVHRGFYWKTVLKVLFCKLRISKYEHVYEWCKGKQMKENKNKMMLLLKIVSTF